tara:strand:+ start:954 stop:1133 length:180 start_codon:yes stop_codon:yes gene_type:complete
MLTSKDLGVTKQTVSEHFATFKEKYCPDDQLCNDLASLGGLVFMAWFMYVAMEPILVFR